MTVISNAGASTITVVIPIEIRRRNGRPKIVLPDGGSQALDEVTERPSGAVVRAIARAWDWRRRLEAGEVSTLQDLATSENVTLPFVSRMIRLAYLSPAVLEHIVAQRKSIGTTLDLLSGAALEPWTTQPELIFDHVL